MTKETKPNDSVVVAIRPELEDTKTSSSVASQVVVAIRPIALDFAASCEYTAMSRSQLYVYVNEGLISSVRYGRKVVFLVAALDNLVAQLAEASAA